MNFGNYLKKLRTMKGLRQVDLAEEIGISVVYVCDIEKGRRYPPDLLRLRKWIKLLTLSDEESTLLLDLAGNARDEFPPDIAEYLETTPGAKRAIRRIMKQPEMFDWESIYHDGLEQGYAKNTDVH